MRIQLSDHFTYGKLLRFVVPSVVMMLFGSFYGVVDGLFVSNFVGKTAFASINLVLPILMIMGSLGFMFGTGGSAIVAKALGEGEPEQANRYFSMLVSVIFMAGLIMTALGLIWLRPVAGVLGAQGEMLENCVRCGRIYLLALTAMMLQFAFQSFFVTAEKPKLGLVVTVAAGVTNILLDALFIVGFGWGLEGAAAATALGQVIGGLLPAVYFIRKNDSLLQLQQAKIDWRVLFKACANGSSELMNSIAFSVVTILYNFQLLHFAGENGVAAYGVVGYVSYGFVAVYMGYAIGSAPIVGYHYGAENHDELKNLCRKSIALVGLCGVAMTLAALALATPLAKIFVGYDAGLLELTLRGYRISVLSFLICGLNIFGSAFFTALNNGLVSAVISFLRTLVFQTGIVMLLPIFLGMDGIWIATVAAELMALGVTAVFFVKNRKKYHYF